MTTGPAATHGATFTHLEVEPDVAEVLRYLGYPQGVEPERRVSECIVDTVETYHRRLRPRGTYSLHAVEAQDGETLRLAGGATFRGAIGEYLSAATRAAVFLGSAGSEIVGLAAQALRAGQTLRGLVLGALGSQLAEGAVEAMMDHLRDHIGAEESLTLRYSPGFCGVDLDQQRLIFQLVDAGAIGVELLPSLMMRPVKSVSGIVGIGPAHSVRAYGSPCEACPRTDCEMRR